MKKIEEFVIFGGKIKIKKSILEQINFEFVNISGNTSKNVKDFYSFKHASTSETATYNRLMEYTDLMLLP